MIQFDGLSPLVTSTSMGSSTLSKDHPTLLSNSGPDQEYDLELDLMVLLARAKYQVKRFHFQLAASLCLERTGAVKSAPQARAKRALDGEDRCKTIEQQEMGFLGRIKSREQTRVKSR